jgi:hypothetical protein
MTNLREYLINDCKNFFKNKDLSIYYTCLENTDCSINLDE